MRNLSVLGALAVLALACDPDSEVDDKMRGDGALDTDIDSIKTDARVARDNLDAGPLSPMQDAAPLHTDGSVSVSPTDGALPSDVASLSWTRCGRAYECAVLTVPLNYEDPAAGSVELALKRTRATGLRVGSLLINPGGPGASAVEFLADFVDFAPPVLRQRFDIVAFDPRGVGQSAPLDCHSTIQQVYAVDGSPDSAHEWDALRDSAQTFADECQRKHAKLLPHLGTPNVARDMDRVRAALGEDKLNYLGYSYGTSIGAWYAELFPGRIRTLVLDGAVDLSLGLRDLALQQAKGFELALGNYFAWCERRGSRCAWSGSDAPEAAFAALRARIEGDPLPAPDADRDLGPGEFIVGVLYPLYGGEDGWRALSEALELATEGDGSMLVEMVDGYLGRSTLDGSYPNQEETNTAVTCADYPAISADEMMREAPTFESEAPIFGVPSLTETLTCAAWPVHGAARSTPTGKGAPPVLVIGTTGDPATPYGWAEAMAKQLESGVLLTNVGEGHTAFAHGNACIDDTVLAYLIDGQVPTVSCADVGASQARLAGSARTQRRWWR